MRFFFSQPQKYFSSRVFAKQEIFALIRKIVLSFFNKLHFPQPSFMHTSLQSVRRQLFFALAQLKMLGNILNFKPSRQGEKGYTIDNRHTATANTKAKKHGFDFPTRTKRFRIHTQSPARCCVFSFSFFGNYYANTHKLITRRKMWKMTGRENCVCSNN